MIHVFKVIGGTSTLFDVEFFQNALVSIIGLAFYYLVVNKIVKLVYSDNEEGFSGTVRLFSKKKRKSSKSSKSSKSRKRKHRKKKTKLD